MRSRRPVSCKSRDMVENGSQQAVCGQKVGRVGTEAVNKVCDTVCGCAGGIVSTSKVQPEHMHHQFSRVGYLTGNDLGSALVQIDSQPTLRMCRARPTAY